MSIDTITAWIQGIVPSLPCVIEPTNEEKPDGEHISIIEVADVASCYPIVTKKKVGDNIEFAAEVESLLTLSVSVFSVNGRSILNTIKAHASLPPLADRPVMRDCSAMRSPMFFGDTSIGPRYQCDFTFDEKQTTTVTDPRVQSVELTGEVAGMESSVAVDYE